VVVSGADLLTLARAVGHAAAKTSARIEAIESAVMPLDAIRSRIAAPRPGTLLSRPPPPLSTPPVPSPPPSPPGESA
jgi:hypothetical protein